MNNEKISLISDLVRRCIGDRSLDQTCKDTGLSKNMLHRLRNGDFLRIPKESIILALTDEKANPQNGITYEDFNIIAKYTNKKDRSNNTNIKSNSNQYSITLIKGIVINWLLDQHGDILIKKDADKFDLAASVGDNLFLFDFKITMTNSAMSINIKDLINKTILSIASSTFNKELSFYIVTNDPLFFDEFRNTPINIASNVRIMLVDIENESVSGIAELN